MHCIGFCACLPHLASRCLWKVSVILLFSCYSFLPFVFLFFVSASVNRCFSIYNGIAFVIVVVLLTFSTARRPLRWLGTAIRCGLQTTLRFCNICYVRQMKFIWDSIVAFIFLVVVIVVANAINFL